MKALNIIAKWLFVLCLPVLMLSASIGLAFNSLWLYKAGFEKYNVSSTTRLYHFELEKAARGLISYFNSREEFIDAAPFEINGKPFTLFNQKEVAHLKDVKGLVWLDYKVFFGTLLYVLAYGWVYLLWQRPQYWRQLARLVFTGSSITLGIMLALGLATLLGFDQLFLQFHLLSFANDFWQLDPSRDYLIMLFPQGFWYDATLFIALGATAAAIIIGGLAGGHLVFNKKDLRSAES